jgi:hypothetical protein
MVVFGTMSATSAETFTSAKAIGTKAKKKRTNKIFLSIDFFPSSVTYIPFPLFRRSQKKNK